jgi:hypothetical protein
MPSNTSINLIDLDFDSLKNSLKNYLTSQQQFKDYDYEGSNMNVLLDILSYNTFKNAFFINMAISEGFIDSSQLRQSIISHAKELNYTPRSTRSSKARVKVNFSASGENQPYIIQKGSTFGTVVKSQSYNFSIPETIVVSSVDTNFSFETDVYEGVYIKDTYLYDDTVEYPRFKITNKTVDTNSITVVVYEDGSLNGDTYSFAPNLLGLNQSSKVYFLQASENGYYEIIFGDGAIGRKPKNNASLIIDYRVSEGSAADGAKSFAINFEPTGFLETTNTIEIMTIESSKNGAEPESIESIRYYAPRHFQVQERTVTASDYQIALKTRFPEINAINVFGGEELNPPRYGKVFVSIDVSNIDGIPDSKKYEYLEFLRQRMPLSIDPLIIEPEFMYFDITSVVRYNLNLSKLTPERIKTLVTNAINEYNNTTLDDFATTLRYSVLLNKIDTSDTSIVSNVTDIKIYKKISPAFSVAQNIDLNFNLKLIDDIPVMLDVHPSYDRHAVGSTEFLYNGQVVTLEDNGNGVVRMVLSRGLNHIRVADVGTVNYETGLVKLTNFVAQSYDGTAIKVFVIPRDKDISSTKNTIFTTEPDAIHLSVEAIRV